MRIISLIPSATETMAALGLGANLVGITHSCDYPPGLQAARVTSTSVPRSASNSEIDRYVKECVREGRPLYELDTELIDRLRPDLIVTQSVCDVCAVGEAQAVGALDQLTVKPEILSLHPHRLDDVIDDVRRVGEAAGVEAAARHVVADLQHRIERVRARTRGVSQVDLVVLEWLDPPYSCGHWTPDVVGLAGGRELLAEPGARSRELTWDEVIAADPEVLVLACCGQDPETTEAAAGRLAGMSRFRELRAVSRGRVHVADGGSHFSRPGPRIVESLELLAETLHPTYEAEALRALP